MKKNVLRVALLVLLVLAGFLVLAFVIPFEHTQLYWLSFAFTLLAVLMQAATIGLAFSKGDSYKSKFYGLPVLRLGLIYLFLQVILGFAGMALGDRVPLWAAAILNVFVLLVFAGGLIGADAARDFVEEQEQKEKAAQSNMRSLQAKAAALCGVCDDAETKGYLTKLAEAFRFSDPVSNAATESMELELSILLDELQTQLNDGDFAAARKTIAKTQSALQVRNDTCKRNK